VAPILLIAIYLLSAVVTPNPGRAYKEIVRLLFLLPIAVLIVWSIKEVDDIDTVLSTFRVTILLLGLIVVFQILTGVYLWNEGLAATGGRYNATMGDPNHLARYMVIGFFAWLFVPNTKGAVRGLVRFLSLALCLATILATQSRGTWVLFAVVLIASAVLGPRRERRRAQLALLAFGMCLPIIFLQSTALLDRLETFQAGLAVAGRRLYLIRAGIGMFLTHPLFGVGLGGFPDEYMTTYRQLWLASGYQRLVLSHTYLVTVAAELGLLGLGVVALFLAQAWQLYHRTSKCCKRNGWSTYGPLVAFIGVLAIFIGSQTEGRFWEDPYLWVFWGLLVAQFKLCISARAPGA